MGGYSEIGQPFSPAPTNGSNGGPNLLGGAGGFCVLSSNNRTIAQMSSSKGGNNFVNTSYVTDYHSTAGLSNQQTFKITFVQFSQITELDVMNLIKQNTQTPMLVVVAGIEFSFNVPVYDHVSQGIETLDTGQGEITIKNLDQTDGIIEVSGLIYQPGYYWIPYKEKVFYLQALESPDSSNITVLLN